MLSLILNINLMAQGPGGGQMPSVEDMVKRTMDGIKKNLTLNDDETASIETIFTDFFTEMDAMHQGGERPDRSKMEKLEASRDKKVKEVLSKENYQAYSKFMENFMKPPQGGGPPPQN